MLLVNAMIAVVIHRAKLGDDKCALFPAAPVVAHPLLREDRRPRESRLISKAIKRGSGESSIRSMNERIMSISRLGRK